MTLNANGGSVSTGSTSVTYGQTYGSLPSPSRTGHDFNGWYTSESGGSQISSGTTVGITSNQTLYAQWTAHTYVVTYNANGGSGTPGNQIRTYGSNLILSSSQPTRTGYDFAGWGKSASTLTVSYAPGAAFGENDSVTLYAIWRERAIYLSSTSTRGSFSSGNTIINYLTTSGTTSFTFTFYTGNTIPNNGVIYQYGSGLYGTGIYFFDSKVTVAMWWDGSSKSTEIDKSSYTLSPNTKYTVRFTYKPSNYFGNITIYNENSVQLASDDFTNAQRTFYSYGGSMGANSTMMKNVAPNIYLISASMTGSTYNTGSSTLKTFTFNAADIPVGTTSISNGGLTMTLNNVSVQWR